MRAKVVSKRGAGQQRRHDPAIRRGSADQPCALDAVDQELHRERREQHADDAAHHREACYPEQPLDRDGDEHRKVGKGEDDEEAGDDEEPARTEPR
jgi:hypothetical protein